MEVHDCACDSSVRVDSHVLVDVEVVVHVLQKDKFDAITCGPEPMMKMVYDMALEKRCHIQVSLERVFKCGERLDPSGIENDVVVNCPVPSLPMGASGQGKKGQNRTQTLSGRRSSPSNFTSRRPGIPA